MLRVDHAGEYGAQCIYRGQLAALALKAALLPSSSPASSSSSPSAESVIEEMRDQELEHLRTLERLLPQHRARPTLLLPLWHVAGYGLGYATALLSTRAAMACTVAVEEVITEHYNDQLRELNGDEWRGKTGEEAERLQELKTVIQRHRDDEEHHRDIGLQHEAEQATFYSALTAAIKAGCQTAIAVAKRV